MRLSACLCMVLCCASPVLASTMCRDAYIDDFSSSTVSSPVTKGFLIQDGCPENHLNARLVSQLTLRFGEQDQSPTENQTIKTAVQSPETPAAGSRRWEILFDFDRADLDMKDLSLLGSVPTGLKVRVEGYTCRLGGEVYNRKLSGRRAAVVAEELEKHGVTVVVQEGRGECCPVSETDLARNRRAVVMEVE
ncbi:OmpA family protein [Geopsychrobacter electrodiphilus]|uniref:OmpA family protein n=1 Tax=Geopsychrobacter electrodiphilus TaxID=225196 RepID=UPI000399C40D|nr:OmpA family protein [Geopsychrobacter electrodiphilus]